MAMWYVAFMLHITTPLWVILILVDCYRCYVYVTRLVIEFLLVDQQNSAKLFAFDSVVRCVYDAPLMVVISPFSMTFLLLLG